MMTGGASILAFLIFFPVISRGFNVAVGTSASCRSSFNMAMLLTGSSTDSTDMSSASRRDFINAGMVIGTSAAVVGIYPLVCCASADAATVDVLVSQLVQAKQQMKAIPALIKKEEWDAVRAILIKPPLSDLWTKSARKVPFLMEYAELVGSLPEGDELAVLEAKEEVEGHIRFLDMAVYNNVFNPIKSMGEAGATKELIRSYYEDPIIEYKAIEAALDELIQLGNVKN